MSELDPIPEENMAWDTYYRLYYNDDNENYTYTTPPNMAEGGYDPTKENETSREDHGIDNDDDNEDFSRILTDEEKEEWQNAPGATSTPYRPGAAYHPGEEHEMTDLSQEQSGLVHTTGEVAWKALTFLFPDAKASEIEAFFDPKSKRLRIKPVGVGQKSHYLLTKIQGTNIERLNPEIGSKLRTSLGKSTLEQVETLQQERDRNSQELREKTQTKEKMEEAAQERQTLRQEMDTLRNQSRQLDDEIRELENRAGPLDEETIQRRKDEKKELEAEHQRKKAQYDKANADAERALKLQVEINDLILANRDIDRQINEFGVKVRKPIDELEQEKAALEKRLADKKLVLEDENASAFEQDAAKKQIEKDERALERVNEDMEREEQKLPLRERVKNIFKKYGWTLQAVALAVGIVLSALALAATNGLKAGTKALGNGLKAIGQKLGSLLPGLIGSIVSFIFKAAGQVLSFLGEHAWLLILAVVAFFMERLLKKRSR